MKRRDFLKYTVGLVSGITAVNAMPEEARIALSLTNTTAADVEYAKNLPDTFNLDKDFIKQYMREFAEGFEKRRIASKSVNLDHIPSPPGVESQFNPNIDSEERYDRENNYSWVEVSNND